MGWEINVDLQEGTRRCLRRRFDVPTARRGLGLHLRHAKARDCLVEVGFAGQELAIGRRCLLASSLHP